MLTNNVKNDVFINNLLIHFKQKLIHAINLGSKILVIFIYIYIGCLYSLIFVVVLTISHIHLIHIISKF